MADRPAEGGSFAHLSLGPPRPCRRPTTQLHAVAREHGPDADPHGNPPATIRRAPARNPATAPTALARNGGIRTKPAARQTATPTVPAVSDSSRRRDSKPVPLRCTALGSSVSRTATMNGAAPAQAPTSANAAIESPALCQPADNVASVKTIEAAPPATATDLRQRGVTPTPARPRSRTPPCCAHWAGCGGVTGVTSFRPRSGRDSRWFFSNQVEAYAARTGVGSCCHCHTEPPRPGPSGQARSNRSRFITLFHAATKSRTNFCCPSSLA